MKVKITKAERRSEIARQAVQARWDGQRRLDRIARAREIASELGIDVGVAEGTLLALTRSPSERLARGLMRGRWARVRE
jgi:LPS O-antigen subunit length determinant protein (WzzB/FepE family)